MDEQINHIVNRLMKVFYVEKPELGQQWANSLISSVNRPDNLIKPVQTSLDEIEFHRGESCEVRELYQGLCRQNDMPSAGQAILHLASRLVADNNTRKFMRIHSILRDAKAKKQKQQEMNNQLNVQPSNNQNVLQQQSQPISAAQQLQTPKPRSHINQNSHPQPSPQVMPSPVPIQRTHPQTPQQYTRQIVQQTPLSTHSQNHQQPSPATPHSLLYISQHNHSHYRHPQSQTKTRRKNDTLHQKMKTFLAENQFLSFDFKKIDWSLVPPIAPLSSMSTSDQEAALIADLLYVLIGTEGKYIRMQPSRESPNKHTIGVERGGDELAYTNATRIIKICPLYSTVVHYAEDVNFGLVNQALGTPVRELVKEYLTLISNLQVRAFQNELTLQSMWLSLQTIYHRMDALKKILDQISKEPCYGGNTLSVLHDRIVNFSTDARTYEFCLKLMESASEPYFEILEKWLYLGIIEDPYGEFFVEDSQMKSENIFNNNRYSNNTSRNGDIDAFWRKRFICDDPAKQTTHKVPNFLLSKLEKIYETGKYLSVIRQYSRRTFRPLPHEPLVYCTESTKYQDQVESAHKYANKGLLELLCDENKLIDRLYSLKRYFLFSSGDLFVQFMDMADDELSKNKDEIDLARLGSLLELAVRTSSCYNDPYKDDVKVRMSDSSLYNVMENINSVPSNSSVNHETRNRYSQSTDTLFGWESLTLSYDVPWPLSMVICKDYSLTLYQMMFRHLFCCKFIERKLEATWKVHKTLKISDHGVRYALLRNKMLYFVHNLLFYMTQIIEPGFQTLISKIREGSIDCVNDVIKLHRAFLSQLVHESMLTDNELLGHVTKLLLLCMDFSVVIDASMGPKSTNRDIFQARIKDINQKFNTNLRSLLHTLDSLALTNKDQGLPDRKFDGALLRQIFENCASN